MHRTFCIAAFVIAVALSARSQAFQPQPFEFYNSYTNMCLQPIDQSTEAGKEVVQEPCEPDTSSGRAAQEWIYYPPGNDGRFMNALSGLCLDARGGAKDKTPVQQWPCNWISNEKWESSQLNPTGGGAAVISRVSGTKSYCLDVPGGQKTAGLALQIYLCNGTAAQTWQLNAKPASGLFVPNVLNLSESDAENLLTTYGLHFTSTNSNNCASSKRGYVIEQIPGSGEPAGNGTVSLVVCNQL